MGQPEERLQAEVDKFRAWAVGREGTYGEWECDYDGWPDLHAAVAAVLNASILADSCVPLLLYALARDNEVEIIRAELEKHSQHGVELARAALSNSEPEARWQLAVFLGKYNDPHRRALLRRYIDDSYEYVRRRALLSAVAHDPVYAEERAWPRLGDPYEYTRLGALAVLDRVQSSKLEDVLRMLDEDPSEYVRAEVIRIRSR